MTLALVVAAAGVVMQTSQACPGCIEMSNPGLMSGMLAGMVLLMAAPFLVVLGIGGGLLRARRRALAEADEREARGG
ncbi:MAG: hypothetical protein ACE5FP_02595 [Gemmatimonadota bacterium]